MSKWPAYTLDGPFSSTSHHQALARPASAMWLGTMSSTSPRLLLVSFAESLR